MKKLLILSLVVISISAKAEWKSVFISGDHSIPNFDNGRNVISEMLAPLGAHAENQTHLTSERSLVKGPVQLATLNNIALAFKNLNVDKSKDGCFLFMTSHGIKNYGFYLSRGQNGERGGITPDQLKSVVDYACGSAPTVLLISSCYSGQFVEKLAADNRVILTAAIKDRPSFGCSTDTTYTFWDECVIDNLPASRTWEELYSGVKACIERKEGELGFNPSLPQAFFGKNVRNLPILDR